MDTLSAARAQMEVSLAFHIVFAALGIGMPLLMVLAEALWLRTGRAHYRDLARKWAKATALTFAIGAVSGTALSFELGLLWPRFMAFAGGIIGPAFALEGYAFFLEAIFLGLYLYGWERLSPRAHLAAGAAVAASGVLSGVLVVAANAWMQEPAGFRMVAGKAAEVSAFAPFLSPAWAQMALHSTLSCYIATSFAAAGVYALGMLRGRRDAYHRAGLVLTLAVGTAAALAQPLSGHVSARHVARNQAAKLAAAEAHFHTRRGAPVIVGGIPDAEAGTVRGALRIPRLLSFLATDDFDGEVKGLDAVPRALWPNVAVTHLAFDVMVGSAFAMIGLGLWFWLTRRRRREPGPWLLRALVAGSPLGIVALEAGWIVTEVGRQPWIVRGVMLTSEGVTPVPGVAATFFGFSALYLVLGIALALLLRRLATGAPSPAETAPRLVEAAHAG
ncbi:cytochrome bd-I ubiquinol oxidase subunit 1 apoprotein [bacterium JGI 053]|nr:cytochrome bd-I ubiquinol oxidase subunit 1 apoprotein [bacterium JGI 053]